MRIAALAELTDAGLRIPVLGGETVLHTNFDYAASAPALASVVRQLDRTSPWYASVHRGAGFASQVTTDLVDQARAVIAHHVGARADDTVVFTRNTTDALNLLAHIVPGDVVALDIEHHANLLPWRSRRVVVGQPTVEATLAALEAELASKPAALVSITGASNVTGEVLPIRAFADLAHRYGARLAVDAAQLLPHRIVELETSDVDYLACSAHKAYAPYGTGALIGRRDWLDDAPAYLAGGGAVNRVELEQVSWHPAPERHEAGTPNVLGIVAFASALHELERIGPAAREAHESALRSRLAEGVASIEGVRQVRGFSDVSDSVGIVTITRDSGSVGLLAAALSAEYGISVRAGRFCAHPFFDRIAGRANGLRASLGLGTTSDDVDRFLDAVARIVHDGPRAEYENGPHGWHPVVDDRVRPRLLEL